MDKTYKEAVFGNVPPPSLPRQNQSDEVNNPRGLAALNRAWATRDFEIKLYWKRATYFWVFIALCFTGYFKLIENTANHHQFLPLIIGCVGLVFSLAWLLVNKGSKFWQENWEAHINCLQNEFEGNIQSVILIEEDKNIFSSYHFSVTKINQVCNVTIILAWLYVIIKESCLYNMIPHFIRNFEILIILIITLMMIIYLLRFCKTSCIKDIKKLKDFRYDYVDVKEAIRRQNNG